MYLEKMFLKDDSSAIAQFQNYALDLFIKGEKIDEGVLKNEKKIYTGVCIEINWDSLLGDIKGFNLYTTRYMDMRQKNFHKSIYYGAGREGIANFFLICNDEEQEGMKREALDSYLKYDSIPFANEAYKFMKTYTPENKKYYKFFDSDKLSTVIIGDDFYAYVRQNGNYLIQIRGGPDLSLNVDSEELYVTDYFLTNWNMMSVFIIDESKGKAYNKSFE